MEQNNLTNTTSGQPTGGGSQQQVVIQMAEQKKSNGLGTAGFVLSLIAIFLCWIPILDWILWALGLIFSFVGVFKRPRGLAIAGLVISLICVVILVAVIGAALAAISSL